MPGGGELPFLFSFSSFLSSPTPLLLPPFLISSFSNPISPYPICFPLFSPLCPLISFPFPFFSTFPSTFSLPLFSPPSHYTFALHLFPPPFPCLFSVYLFHPLFSLLNINPKFLSPFPFPFLSRFLPFSPPYFPLPFPSTFSVLLFPPLSPAPVSLLFTFSYPFSLPFRPSPSPSPFVHFSLYSLILAPSCPPSLLS